MAVYEAPVRHEDHYIERDASGGTSAGFWAVIVVLAVVLLLLLFGSNLFTRGGTGSGAGTNIQGEINVPSGGNTGTQ